MKNLKSKIFGISVVINIILGILLVTMIPEMMSELYEEYVDDSRPDYTGYLDRENYGIMAGEVGRSNRVGAQVPEIRIRQKHSKPVYPRSAGRCRNKVMSLIRSIKAKKMRSGSERKWKKQKR